MRRDRLDALLHEVAAGRVAPEAAARALATAPAAETLAATVDLHRAARQGFPEVVLAQGKTPAQTVAIVERLAEAGDGVLVTRADEATLAALIGALPTCDVSALARTARIPPRTPLLCVGAPVLVITAGTSDLPVAEEAAVTAESHGALVERVTDVGVAGIHRLAPHLDRIAAAGAIIVVAGMEGALPSVIGGIAAAPVIAVPTSTGYGASFGGVAALLGMLNSCAAGVTVVNIDNGFGAGVAAARIVRGSSRATRDEESHPTAAERLVAQQLR